MAMPIATPNPSKMEFVRIMPSSSSLSSTKPNHLLNLKPVHCAQQEIDVGILCEPCNGKGWLLCDFCEGQKTNVKAANNRIYRRCPSCKAKIFSFCSLSVDYDCLQELAIRFSSTPSVIFFPLRRFFERRIYVIYIESNNVAI
ncbi:hypothetical protein Ddye_006807 [Dipteronia dyeriana]|uniref:Uncharacterized protein n=1 Tax=Dipteronia dyeriana TaxID=168575 RepID=A0AAD9XIW9_9ROSI|nr:hypothetical protein Ddye_006807 [Dipteronia dyeriana]